MSDHSKIEWTNASWNPIRGCTKISPGCRACYAETFAERFRGVVGHPYEQGFDLRLVPEKLDEPLSWKKPRLVFVCSMSDLFHKDVPEEYIVRVFQTMQRATRHTFQVLTKRPERMAELAKGPLAFATKFPHLWWGVTVENRPHGLPRLEILRSMDVAVRWVSAEPLLEDLGEVDLAGIHWVVAGGESGRQARAMELDWVRSLRDRCEQVGAAFFFKQALHKGKMVSLPLLDGRQWTELPGR